ncbi:Ribosomal large subunit pseudouridine(746) synthase @ tRNA pseudouridine(32) synthase [hydrothermal vent metagenome]|uniref:Dual-specificity RNA pseudouridine synthase RluA n=1 Tax=hydrothermal vent metagenome TaxID=652676 RepID=A0A3B0WHY6_9ZZZZ
MLLPLLYTPPLHTGLHILYQDNDIIALNKPSGLLSVPGRGEDKQDCMLSRLQIEYPQALVIHRLDMPTSGLILFALTKVMQKGMSKLFERKEIHKQYIANVHGVLKEPKGIIDQPLITDWNNRPKQKIDYQSGKSSQTKYTLISSNIDNYSTVKLEPITGRSHQLRVHMSSLGHAILGDVLYGTIQTRQASNRLLLHAEKITFKHPISNKIIDIVCPCEF